MKRKLPLPEVLSSEKGMLPSPKRPETRHTQRRPCADEYNAQYRKPKDNYSDRRPEHA